MANMNQNRFKSAVFYGAAGTALLLALAALLIIVEQRRTQVETGAVLSAFFSREVLHDIDTSDPGRTITIVVMRNPDCRICAQPPIGPESQSWFAQSVKSRGCSVSEAWFVQSAKMTRASFFLNSIFSRNLSTDVRLPSGARAVFVDPSDLGASAGEFEARFPDNFGYFVVSHVGLNLNKTEALLYVDHFCGGLCGGGEYVLMRRVNGVWHVVDSHVTWVS